MNSGLTFARAFNLSPGIALSAAQIASLTSDIVWLEQQAVTLADGSITQAIVPHVYAAIRAGDLAPSVWRQQENKACSTEYSRAIAAAETHDGEPWRL